MRGVCVAVCACGMVCMLGHVRIARKIYGNARSVPGDEVLLRWIWSGVNDIFAANSRGWI